jgi:hypothetical protein
MGKSKQIEANIEQTINASLAKFGKIFGILWK